MRIALAGQPNCGKSTLFNRIAGYKAITSNFPGTTVKYTETKIQLSGYICNCLDLPGTYSLTSEDAAEFEARQHLLSGKVDVIVNVVDSSLLCRSLELTLQLLELQLPMVLCLNMIDEAQRKGIQIDPQKLTDLLGIPVVITMATTGRGIKELFNEVIKVFAEKRKGKILKFSRDLEEIIEQLVAHLSPSGMIKEKVSLRFLALKLLEGDPFFLKEIEKNEKLVCQIRSLQEKLIPAHGVPADQVITSERHALAMNLFEKVSTIIHPPQKDIRLAIDNLVMHKFFGYIILIAFLYGFFNFIFGMGKYIEEPLMEFFDQWIGQLGSIFRPGSLLFSLFKGVTRRRGGNCYCPPLLGSFFNWSLPPGRRRLFTQSSFPYGCFYA